jgi:hypothetical protein
MRLFDETGTRTQEDCSTRKLVLRLTLTWRHNQLGHLTDVLAGEVQRGYHILYTSITSFLGGSATDFIYYRSRWKTNVDFPQL